MSSLVGLSGGRLGIELLNNLSALFDHCCPAPQLQLSSLSLTVHHVFVYGQYRSSVGSVAAVH